LGLSDYWIVKVDSLGSIQWQNTIGGEGNDDIRSVEQTSDGGYILCGSSYSSISGDKSESALGQVWDYWILKTDALGNIQWDNTIGGFLSDVSNTIIQTSDEGYVLGGQSVSNISGDKAENCKGNEDFWIMKLTDKYNLITGNLFVRL
jgi:hypothetical protein